MAVRRFGQVIRVRTERIEEYEALHAAPWPGVLAAIERIGVLVGATALCERVHELVGRLEGRGSSDDPGWDDPIGPTGLTPLVAATRERLRMAGATRA